MKNIQKVLIGRIDALCKQKGLSYYTLSYKSAIPLPTLMHILKGTTKSPGIDTIAKICEGLEVSLKEFFDTEDF